MHEVNFTMHALSSSYITDRLLEMRRKEETTYRCKDYRRISAATIRKEDCHKPVDGICRSKMCEWCFQVIDSCDFSRETAAAAIANVDRFVYTRKGREVLMDRDKYKLAVVTSLYIAIKIYEPIQLNVSTLSALSRGIFLEKDYISMERQILMALQWRITGPTATSYVETMMNLVCDVAGAYVASIVGDIATKQAELAIRNQMFVDYLPSEIGFAAVLNATAEAADVGVMSPQVQQKIVYVLEKCLKLSVSDVSSTQVLLGQLCAGARGRGRNDNIVDREGVIVTKGYDVRNPNATKAVKQHGDSPVSIVK